MNLTTDQLLAEAGSMALEIRFKDQALSYAGNLPAACGQPLTDAALMRLAAQAAGGH